VISEEDDKRGGPFVVVLGHALWQRQFGGDPGVIGQTVTLSGNNYAVAGVMPASFRTPRGEADLWAPVQVAYPLGAAYRGVHFLQTTARLKPGVTIAQARSEMGAIDKRLAEAFPEENKRRQTVLFSLRERIVGEIKPALLVLFGAVGLVLLIACANFANLLTMRIDLPEARYREIPAQTQYRRALLEEVNSQPGARAALVSELPMSGDWLTPDEWRIVRRFAPRLYTTPTEFFQLKDFAAVLHPTHRQIAYHFFWEDDIDFPEDNDSCDHELIWVQYSSDRTAIEKLRTYFHGRILEGGEAALADARRNGLRPRVNVQSGMNSREM
jgi:hypothetical protein